MALVLCCRVVQQAEDLVLELLTNACINWNLLVMVYLVSNTIFNRSIEQTDTFDAGKHWTKTLCPVVCLTVIWLCYCFIMQYLDGLCWQKNGMIDHISFFRCKPISTTSPRNSIGVIHFTTWIACSETNLLAFSSNVTSAEAKRYQNLVSSRRVFIWISWKWLRLKIGVLISISSEWWWWAFWLHAFTSLVSL